MGTSMQKIGEAMNKANEGSAPTADAANQTPEGGVRDAEVTDEEKKDQN